MESGLDFAHLKSFRLLDQCFINLLNTKVIVQSPFRKTLEEPSVLHYVIHFHPFLGLGLEDLHEQLTAVLGNWHLFRESTLQLPHLVSGDVDLSSSNSLSGRTQEQTKA